MNKRVEIIHPLHIPYPTCSKISLKITYRIPFKLNSIYSSYGSYLMGVPICGQKVVKVLPFKANSDLKLLIVNVNIIGKSFWRHIILMNIFNQISLIFNINK